MKIVVDLPDHRSDIGFINRDEASRQQMEKIMKLTHNQAIELFQKGEYDAAWDMAQRDEGLLPHVQKNDWLKFAAQCVERRKEFDIQWSMD